MSEHRLTDVIEMERVMENPSVAGNWLAEFDGMLAGERG